MIFFLLLQAAISNGEVLHFAHDVNLAFLKYRAATCSARTESMNQWLERCPSLGINNVYKQAQKLKLTETQRGEKTASVLFWFGLIPTGCLTY